MKKLVLVMALAVLGIAQVNAQSAPAKATTPAKVESKEHHTTGTHHKTAVKPAMKNEEKPASTTATPTKTAPTKPKSADAK